MPIGRPNILWVSFEDTNPFYGCYGDPVARTPNLDRLAADGGRWPNAFSTAGVCAPARSAVITGMYPISIGTHHMRTTHTNPAAPELPTPYSAVVPHYVKCFPEYLRAAGYYCTNNVKTDYQFDPPLTAWDELSQQAHWRNRPDANQPFFAVFNLGGTHESAMWPERTPEIAFDPAEMPLPPYFPDTPKVRTAMARMYTQIERNDRLLGKLLDQLDADGLADSTVVFHWSDHGPLPRGKRWPYDSGIRVPMIVRWPGRIEPGSVSNRLVSTIDLAPTVLSIARVRVPAHMQGRAFLGPAAGPARHYVYASRDRHDESYDMVRAVRDKRLKQRLQSRCNGIGDLELYDTRTDPWEIRNLARDPACRADLARLRKALDEWRSRVGDLGEIPEAEMVRRWYPGGRQPQTAPPVFIPICEASPGIPPADDGGHYRAPLLLQMHSATQGASIAYALGREEQPRWRLYTVPIRLPEGTTTVRARAVRIGYQDSPTRSATLHVDPPAAASPAG